MRLLLLKQPQLPPPSRQPPPQAIAERLLPLVENILAKKCLLEESKTPLQDAFLFYSTLEAESHIHSFKVTLELVPKHSRALYRTTLLRGGLPIVVSSEMRINLIHKVNRKALATDSHALEIDASGQIHIVSRLHYSQLLFASPSQLMREVDMRLRALIKASLALLPALLLETNQPSRTAEELKETRSLHLQKVKRHIFFSCYDLGLSEKASEYRHPTEQTLRKREKIIKSLLRPEAQEVALREGCLWGREEGRSVENSKEWRREFESTYYFEKLLQIPVAKTTNPAENPFIFNEIVVDNPEQVVAQDLPVGGGCLKVMALSAAYATGGAQPQKAQFMQKVVVAKWAKGESGRQRAKLMHERNIVRLFSSAHSGYLLKYYGCSQPGFAHSGALLMDYHAGTVPLLEHLQLRRDSLSLEGKLALLAHISNGLRFLNYYKVVHMDLTLSNVLVYDGHLPKLIDFGEAYHRDTVDATLKNAYAPGFTLPYCAPEVFRNKQFTSAQDMFSFGVMIFRLLLSALPVFPADSLVQVYRSGAHHQRLLFAPEAVEAICQRQACYLLLQLVNLCLRALEDARPLPIWTTIILKEILTEVFF